MREKEREKEIGIWVFLQKKLGTRKNLSMCPKIGTVHWYLYQIGDEKLFRHQQCLNLNIG